MQIEIPVEFWIDIRENMTTGEKGRRAVELVANMLEAGKVPLEVKPQEVKDKALQIKGTDITVTSDTKIQVKCDYNSGHKGTGNLFLQVEECNPLGEH